MTWDARKQIEISNKLRFERCKILAKTNVDYKIQYPQDAKEANKDSPIWTELKKRIADQSTKRQERLERKRAIMRR